MGGERYSTVKEIAELNNRIGGNMKAKGLKQSGCVLKSDGWYKDDKFLGKTTTEARKELRNPKK